MSEVCFLVGYDSVTTFSGLFTRSVGKTPSEYANEFRERRTKIEIAPLSFVPGCYSFMHGWANNSNFEDVDN